MRRSLFALIVMLVLGLARSPSAQKSPCEFEGIERIVAVGDVHGAYDQILPVLKDAKIIDNRLRWVGGKTHFVQLGDVLDRGPDSRKVLDLYRRLESQSQSAGGRFHYLMGNHEARRLAGDYRDVHPGEYAAFVTPRSEETRLEWLDKSGPALGTLIGARPIGAVEMMSAFASDGDYGRLIGRLNAIVRINGILFVHGGLSPLTAAMPCATINDTIGRELTVDLQKTRAAGVNGIASLSFGNDGPLWYRGLSPEFGPDTIEPQVDAMLRAQKATSIVVAHTAQLSGRMVVRFGGKVMVIDTGMQPQHVSTGRASALEIKGGVFTAIYPDKREVIVRAQVATSKD